LSIWAIIGIILGVIILIFVVVWIIGHSGSSDSEILKPDGAITGKALVVYDPGLSGGTKTAATYMAEDLTTKGYEVKLASVKSGNLSDLSGYNFLIVGSPTYGAKPTEPITSYLNSLENQNNITAGVFALSAGDKQDAEIVMKGILENKSITVKVAVKYGNSAFGLSADRSKCSNFVSQVLA
jgi:flavorubredoxin